MGGIVACLYAGVRPSVSANWSALKDSASQPPSRNKPPARLKRWLDEQRQPQTFHTHGDLATIAQRLRKNNPRLSDDQAQFLAPWLAQQTGHGAIYRADPPKAG